MSEVNDTIKRLNVGSITDTEETIFDYTNGAVVKTILISNMTTIEQELVLNIDGAKFIHIIPSNTTISLTNYFICNILKAKLTTESQTDEESNPILNTINYHISGIQLGDN